MSKAMMILNEMPRNCLECPLRYEAETVPLGNFTYQKLFRCRVEPEDLDEDTSIYLEDIRHEKPDWCPLQEIVI